MTTPTPTYAAHKTAIDAAYPTPTPVWRLHMDDPRHEHDDYSVARAEFDFAEEQWVIEATFALRGENEFWFAWVVKGDATLSESYLATVSGSSWALSKQRFTPGLTRGARRLVSTWRLRHSGEKLLAADGITYGVVNLTSLSVDGPSQADVALSLRSMRTPLPTPPAPPMPTSQCGWPPQKAQPLRSRRRRPALRDR